MAMCLKRRQKAGQWHKVCKAGRRRGIAKHLHSRQEEGIGTRFMEKAGEQPVTKRLWSRQEVGQWHKACKAGRRGGRWHSVYRAGRRWWSYVT